MPHCVLLPVDNTGAPAMQMQEINESDCCGNGCTNCILDHKPQPSARALLEGKRNVILNYAKFQLLHRQAHNEDDDDDAQVWLLHFGYIAADDADDEASILDIPPGHHVMLRATLPTQPAPLLRPYSPYWVDFARKQFKILVKLQPGGPMSSYIASLLPSAVLEFRGPIGTYAHDARTPKCIYIIAQGVAIAPTLPLVAQVLDNEEDMSRIYHLICARNLQHLYFRERLLEFGKYWNYRSSAYLAHQQCGSAECKQCGACVAHCAQLRASLRYKEVVLSQRLNASELVKLAATKTAGESVLIIAGHASFQRAMREEAASALGVAEANIYLL